MGLTPQRRGGVVLPGGADAGRRWRLPGAEPPVRPGGRTRAPRPDGILSRPPTPGRTRLRAARRPGTTVERGTGENAVRQITIITDDVALVDAEADAGRRHVPRRPGRARARAGLGTQAQRPLPGRGLRPGARHGRTAGRRPARRGRRGRRGPPAGGGRPGRRHRRRGPARRAPPAGPGATSRPRRSRCPTSTACPTRSTSGRAASGCSSPSRAGAAAATTCRAGRRSTTSWAPRGSR